MVAVAVLIGLMGIIAMVFSSASKASGQAQASTALYRVVEQVAETIRQDLESIDPSQSVLGIARVDVLAYATPEDVETQRLAISGNATLDDWHRADMLMVVSKRKFEPYIFQRQSNTEGFEECRQVIYGHANFGKLIQTAPNAWAWLADPTHQRMIEPADVNDPSPIPASKWHLARRVVGSPDADTALSLQATPRANMAGWPLVGDGFTGNTSDQSLCSDLFVDTSIAPPATLERLLDETDLGLRRGTAAYNNLGVLASLCHRDACFYYRESASGSSALYCLAQDRADPLVADTGLYWWRLADPALPTWVRTIDPGTGPITRTWTTGGTYSPPPINPTTDFPPNRYPVDATTPTPYNWLQWFYVPNTTPPGLSRTRIDPNPPPGRTDRMAAYLLPGCSDFKIEFTYDDPREIAVGRDPAIAATYGNPILTPDVDSDGVAEYDIDGTLAGGFTPAPQAIRWQSLDGPQPLSGKTSWTQVQVWNRIGVEGTDYGDAVKDAAGNPLDLRDLTLQPADAPPSTATVRPTFRWPRAIRITLRVWDPAGRLEDPIVHTIVHTFE